MFAEANAYDAISQFWIAVPATLTTIFAFLAARRSGQTKAQVETNHGKRPGEYLELIADLVDSMKNAATSEDVKALHAVLADHTRADAENFEALQSAIEELKNGD